MTERELINDCLERSNFPSEAASYQQHWLDCEPGFETSNFLEGFETPDRRFHFKPDWSRVGPDFSGMPVLPDHMSVANEVDAVHPYRLVAAPARQFLNTSFTETRSSRRAESRPTLMLHPDDAIELKVNDGDLVRVGNALGEVQMHVKCFEGVQTGVVIAESIWPNRDFVGGWGINTLVSADPGPPNGGAIYHDTAVWVEAAPIPV